MLQEITTQRYEATQCSIPSQKNSVNKIWRNLQIGEVVDGPEDNVNRAVLDGVQYDYGEHTFISITSIKSFLSFRSYVSWVLTFQNICFLVFDVDIGDGEPIRKLPYNRADNPYTAADKWLLKESLPLSYRQQVVEFILQNSGQKDFALDTSYRDPYTGSSAYIPGETSNLSGMLFFEVAQFDGILKKISEFNNSLLSEVGQNSVSLTELDLSRLAAIVKILKDTSHYHSTTFADTDIALLVKLLKSWPPAMMFPVIDILRMVVLHPDGASSLAKHIEDGNDMLLETFKKATEEPALPGNLLTITRLMTNIFKNPYFHQWLQLHRSEILDALSCCCSSSNKNVNLSYSTLVLNYAVLLIEKRDQEGQAQVLSAALEMAEEGNQDPDSKFRALVVIGSLMLEGLVKSIAIDFDVRSIAKGAKTSKEVKIAEVGADIELLINAA
ncbi:phospholipase A-2-activating protein isoform X1 [Cinnamomum micranthum f. kanehirae]|uniref:Phospholipase A-2-activating protein isoform X1 n=1 Tax=Cinnamomum micranthum f. kanehirae TaxID=337451 RepID=A0A443N1B2_9MAGN|nr:phospholipase A-2-activating protein isoform X1 [Cinnamomum micranthum f. kanehirae]